MIAFNNTSIPEQIIHQKTGLLVETGDVGAHEGMIEGLMRDREFASILGRNARSKWSKDSLGRILRRI